MASPSDGQGVGSSAATGGEALTRSRLDRLLALLAATRDDAAVEYENIRRRLVRLFEWWGSAAPDEDADHTIDRVARKLEEGEVILNPRGYFHGVARHVFLESGRRHARDDAAARELLARAAATSPETEARVVCLERCLGELPPDARDLIVRYYQGPGRSHLEGRKGLAQEMGITYALLKAKAHRLRGRLEACLGRCLDVQTNEPSRSHEVRGKR